MSRTFSKILVICALVVLFPLLIVGSALAAYHSIDNTVNLEVYFVDELKSSDTNQTAKVVYKNQSGEKLKVDANHLSSIKVGVDSTVAYQWKGWFKGTKNDYKTAQQGAGVTYLSDGEKAITIDMKNEGTYLAVFEVVQYNMTYSYKADPAGSATTGSVEGFPTTLVYGETLPNGEDLPLTNNNYYFSKWTFGGEGGETVTKADFSLDGLTVAENGKYDVTIYANYSVIGTVDVSYVAPANMLQGKTEKVTLFTEKEWKLNEEKTLKTPAQVIADYNQANPQNEVSLEPGYRYFWQVNGVEATNYKPETEGAVEIVLAREELSYFANVTASSEDQALMKDASALPASVKFSAEDKSEVTALLNIEAKRSYNKVAGIKINDDNLLTTEEAIITKLNGIIENSQVANITVVMTNNFRKVTFTKITFENDSEVLGVEKNGELVPAKLNALFDDTDSADSNDTTTTLSSNWFDLFTAEDEFVQYKNEEGGDVVLKEIIVTFSGSTTIRIDLAENQGFKDMTVADIVEKLWNTEEIKSLMTAGESVTIESMVFNFVDVK